MPRFERSRCADPAVHDAAISALAKSTMCSWHEQLAQLAKPLVDAMFEDAYQQPYLCTDATGVLVQAKERCRNGHFWVLVAPEKHVLYRYSKHHDSDAVDALLAGYKGYLVADAHAVYDHLYREGDVIEVACWAHCRRYYFKALASDPERAKVALAHIGALFRIERTIADSPRQKKEQVRAAKARPIVDKFFEWCDAEAPNVLDESPIQAAITYARNQRVALRRFLDDGRLPAHNNISELNLRRQVLGRRNWLFVGNDDGAKTNTVFVSLLASARLHGIDPVAYIRDLLCLIRGWPPERLLELAPAYWQKTLEQPETQQKLAANVFRRVVLSTPA
jgi:transposase